MIADAADQGRLSTPGVSGEDFTDHVAADGSPAAVYLALPPGRAPDLVGSVTPVGGSVLELGSGPGRHTRPLVARGFDVVAVDESAEMLTFVENAQTIASDIYELRLNRAFDTVLCAGNLICSPDVKRRRLLLDVCRRHIADRGWVLLDRYDPEWAKNPQPVDSEAGEVKITFTPLEISEAWFRGVVTYNLGKRQWTQEFTAAVLSDEQLADEAGAVGLEVADWFGENRTWAGLRPSN